MTTTEPDHPFLPCLCCGSLEIDERGGYEICRRCNWEDDPVQAENPGFAGGANVMSLEQARREWMGRIDAGCESSKH
ncbi:CPCC family cysteine-rich protein [Lysobacter firmicutimachus]|uniref:CPCC family cysteine-rich protein n=1 Tax=Lysobacter firmicutimachus TaxID=1792846 RepID=A0AAU8MT13_9GAMM|nr:CPCC family cysteine-rich protein [Lysobacter antibioticus]